MKVKPLCGLCFVLFCFYRLILPVCKLRCLLIDFHSCCTDMNEEYQLERRISIFSSFKLVILFHIQDLYMFVPDPSEKPQPPSITSAILEEGQDMMMVSWNLPTKLEEQHNFRLIYEIKYGETNLSFHGENVSRQGFTQL